MRFYITIRRQYKTSEQDLYYAEYLEQEGIGFFITDNTASTLNTVVPPIITKKINH